MDGEEIAVTECYRSHAPLVRGYLRHFIPQQDVEDVLQIVFGEVWRSRRRYDPRRSLEGWVLGIARNRAIDYLRARHPATVPLDGVPEPRDHVDAARRLDDRDQLRRALRHLPEVQREAITLAYYGDLTQREIAEHLDVPLGTVKARTARALHTLSSVLTEAA